MVRPGHFKVMLLALCLGLVPSLPALTETAQADMAPLPARPEPDPPTDSNPVEDFAAVTIVSMPFTAFWSLVGALAVAGVSQGRFPPEIDTPMMAGAASVAAAMSVSIGLVSIRWGGSKQAPKP